MKHALIYIRVSDEEQQKRNVANLPTQQKKCQDRCDHFGLPVLKVFREEQSARTADDRPEFQKLLDYCRENKDKVSHVVVADLSRFARNMEDQVTAMTRLARMGITLLSVDEPHIDRTAAGRLTANLLGAVNQFYSDSLSERVRYRMQEAVKAGRFVNRAPIGYRNVQNNGSKCIVVDRERAALIKKSFELIASGSYSSDAVLRTVSALGLRTPNGLVLPKQSFSKMLKNPIYAGWVCFPSSNLKCKGNHEAIVSDEMFNAVQDTLAGKRAPVPKQRQNPDFPLRGFVGCYKCGKPLTAAAPHGRSKQYPRYWCWQKGCYAVSVSKEVLEKQFVELLGMVQPTAEGIARLPQIAAANWELRKKRVADDKRALQGRLNQENTLNRRAIEAKLTGDLSPEDFSAFKIEVTSRIAEIEKQIKSLDSELSMMDELLAQADMEAINLAMTWKKGGVNEKQELQLAVFPEGLLWSSEMRFFEPGNTSLRQSFQRLWKELEEESSSVQVGCGGWI